MIKRFLLKAAAVAVIAAALLLALEVCARWLFPEPAYPIQPYGWHHADSQGRPVRSKVEDEKGVFREITTEYFQHGFKRWGDVGAPVRVLIVGDSFTDMGPWVSNGEEWYAQLERAFPDWSFFVSGNSGYGTVQQYLVLKDRIDQIRPHLILWQMCTNDYENNSYYLSRTNYPADNMAPRPFFEKGRIRYRLPMPLGDWRYRSRLIDRLMLRFDQRARSAWVEEVTRLRGVGLGRQGFPWWRDTVVNQAVTDLTVGVFKKVRTLAPDVPVVLFSATNQGSREKRICETNGFILVEGLEQELKKHSDAGERVMTMTSMHWNLRGNRIVGEYLVTVLKQLLSSEKLRLPAAGGARA